MFDYIRYIKKHNTHDTYCIKTIHFLQNIDPSMEEEIKWNWF